MYHVHGLEELTSSKCPYYPKQFIDLVLYPFLKETSKGKHVGVIDMSFSRSSRDPSWPRGRMANVWMVGEVKEQKEGQIT